MPYSKNTFDAAVRYWVLCNVKRDAKILDVGPGVGKWGRVLGEVHPGIDAVEVFEPYVRKYKLRDVYREVFIQDVRDFPVEDYDLVILGDMLEHLSIPDAKLLLHRCKRAIIQVPFLYVQDVIENNPYEIHLQEDLTTGVMEERYPELKELFPARDGVGVYLLDEQARGKPKEVEKTGFIGLLIHAIGLPEEAEIMMKSFHELGPITEHVKVCVITEKEYPEADMVNLNVGEAKNIGLRKLLPLCDGVVCIDVDYILPPGLFELLLEPSIQPFHVWIRRRDCTTEEAKERDWKNWGTRKVFEDCWGSCNYLSRENWLRLGGWDERTFGWGGDDDILHIRIGQVGIERRRIDAFPLMHLHHERRLWNTEGLNSIGNLKWVNIPQPNFLEECNAPGSV